MKQASTTIDFDKIRSIEWDWTGQTNMQGPAALICPACCAHVPHSNSGLGVSYRERHIRFHEVNADRVPII